MKTKTLMFLTSVHYAVLAIIAAFAMTAAVAADPGGDLDYAIKNGGNDQTRAAARLLHRGDAEAAIPILNGVVASASRTALRKIAYSNLCAAHAMQGDAASALAACNEALALDGGYWEALVNRGKAHSLAGDSAAALTDLRAAEALRPDDKLISRHIAALEANQGRAGGGL
ncbi:MAG: hypothetical protein ACOY99_00900 [Pseudomonadota bacterium]